MDFLENFTRKFQYNCLQFPKYHTKECGEKTNFNFTSGASFLLELVGPFPSSLLPPFKKRVLVENFLHENEFDLHDSGCVGKNLFIWMVLYQDLISLRSNGLLKNTKAFFLNPQFFKPLYNWNRKWSPSPQLNTVIVISPLISQTIAIRIRDSTNLTQKF